MYFIVSQSKKLAILQHSTHFGSDPTGWERYHRENSTQTEWVEYFGYNEDRSPTILRRKDLSTTLSELVPACLSSHDEDDWKGLAIHLNYINADLNQLLETFQKHAASFPRNAKSIFRQYFRPADQRNLIGLRVDQVEESYKAFIDISNRISEALK